MGKNLKGKECGKGICQRKDGQYYARFVNRSGKRQDGYFATLPEARNWLEDARYQDKHGKVLTSPDMTVTEWFQFWQAELLQGLSPNTKRNYRDRFELNIKPIIGDMRLVDVKPMHCKIVLNRMEAKYAGSTDDRRYAEAIITTTFRNYPKDLHDISAAVLDNKMADVRAANEGVQNGMVNNPWMRISNEMLTPYSAYFRDVIDSATRAALTGNEAALIQWVKDSIRVVDDCNLGGSPISPEGVWRTRMADPHSRDIFFVALAHSLGRPAEIDPVTGKVKIYRFHELDTDTMSREELIYELRKMFRGYEVNLDETSNSEAKATPVGELKMTYTPTAVLPNPKYYSHFSLSSIDAGGRLHLLEYPEPDITADGITFSDFKDGKRIDAGNYLLVTGTRMAGGNVLATMTFFSVKPDETVEIPLTMRTDDKDIQVIGDFNSEGLYLPLADVKGNAGDATSVLSTTGRGYFVIGILGAGEEPTNHALKDIAAMSKELEQWGRPMILLFPDDDSRSRFKKEEFPGLPKTVSFGIDHDDTFRREIIKNLNLNENAPLPLFIIADTFNRVVYVSQGYTIGLGEQLHRVITKL